jgi:hypothetical protein
MKYNKTILALMIAGTLSFNVQAEESNIESNIKEPSNIVSVCKHTAMHYATSIEKYSYVEALLKRKEFTLFELNYQCETPIHIASELGNVAILNLFYSYLGNFEVVNKKGQTPIMTAVENNQHQAILFMVEKGINLEHKDNKGKSVKDYFNENGDYLTQKILKNQENKSIISNFEVKQINKDSELDQLTILIKEKELLILRMTEEGVDPEIIKLLNKEIVFLKERISNLETIIKAQEMELAELRSLRELYENNLKDTVNNSPVKKKDNLNSHIPEEEYKELLEKFKKSDETDLNQLSDELKLMELLSKPMYKIEKK